MVWCGAARISLSPTGVSVDNDPRSPGLTSPGLHTQPDDAGPTCQHSDHSETTSCYYDSDDTEPMDVCVMHGLPSPADGRRERRKSSAWKFVDMYSDMKLVYDRHERDTRDCHTDWKQEKASEDMVQAIMDDFLPRMADYMQQKPVRVIPTKESSYKDHMIQAGACCAMMAAMWIKAAAANEKDPSFPYHSFAGYIYQGLTNFNTCVLGRCPDWAAPPPHRTVETLLDRFGAIPGMAPDTTGKGARPSEGSDE